MWKYIKKYKSLLYNLIFVLLFSLTAPWGLLNVVVHNTHTQLIFEPKSHENILFLYKKHRKVNKTISKKFRNVELL